MKIRVLKDERAGAVAETGVFKSDQVTSPHAGGAASHTPRAAVKRDAITIDPQPAAFRITADCVKLKTGRRAIRIASAQFVKQDSAGRSSGAALGRGPKMEGGISGSKSKQGRLPSSCRLVYKGQESYKIKDLGQFGWLAE